MRNPSAWPPLPIPHSALRIPHSPMTLSAIISERADPPGDDQPIGAPEQGSDDPAEGDANQQPASAESPQPMAERIQTANQQVASALDRLRQPETGGSGDVTAISRLLAIVEEIHRTTSSHGGTGVPADIIARIERLETWVATNRLP